MLNLSGETWLEHRAPGHTGDYLACSQVLAQLLEKTTAKVGPGGLRGTLEQVELGAEHSFARNHQLPLKSVRIEVLFLLMSNSPCAQGHFLSVNSCYLSF